VTFTRRRVVLAVRLLVGAAVVLLGWRFVRRLDLGALVEELRRAELPLIALATLLQVPFVWSKARRTRLLLLPVRPLPTLRLANLFVASFAADNLFMSQAGVALRIGVLRRYGIPLVTAAGEQAIEKVMEGVSLLALVPLAPLGALGPSTPSLLRHPLTIVLVVLASVALLVALALGARRHARAGAPGWLGRLARAAVALRDPLVAVECALLSALAWAVQIAMVALALAALHLPHDLSTSALVVVAFNLAALIPGLPANTGTFEAAVVLALSSMGIAQVPALGFALMIHAINTIPVTLAGFPGLYAARSTSR
jgi:uncharacterized membrane protein YbhN (UPF0104 family)